MEGGRLLGLYQEYFPGGLTRIGEMNTSDQIDEVSRILAKLAADEVVGDLASIVQPGYDEIVEIMKEKDEVEDRLARLKREEKSLKARWVLSYKNTRDELKIAFNQHRRRVDAFFKDVKYKRRKKVASPTNSEAPREIAGPTTGGDGADREENRFDVFSKDVEFNRREKVGTPADSEEPREIAAATGEKGGGDRGKPLG